MRGGKSARWIVMYSVVISGLLGVAHSFLLCMRPFPAQCQAADRRLGRRGAGAVAMRESASSCHGEDAVDYSFILNSFAKVDSRQDSDTLPMELDDVQFSDLMQSVLHKVVTHTYRPATRTHACKNTKTRER